MSTPKLWSNISGVLFDLDGTLFDTAQEIHVSANLMLSELGLAHIDPEVSTKLIGKGAHNFVERALNAVGASPDFQEHGLESFLKHYEQVTGTLAPAFEGVFEALEQLAVLKLPMAIVTNKQQNLAEKILKQHRVTHYFSVIMGGDRMLRKKPDAWSILETCRLLGITPESALFVGDSDNDVDAAKAARVRCVVLPYGYSGGKKFDELGADGVISNLLEIVQHLKQA